MGTEMSDWTSVRVRRSTLQRLKQTESEDESHDELLSSLLDSYDR